MGLTTERAALAVLLAWALMYVWGLVEVGVVHPPLPTIVWLPVGGVCLAGLTYRGSLHAVEPDEGHQEPRTVRNPFRPGPSITFGGLCAVLLVLPNGAQWYFGDVGVCLSRVVVGLADRDAITLLVAQLTQEGDIDSRTATRAIVIAAANTVLKGSIVAVTGSRGLRRATVPGVVITVLASAIAVILI